MAKFLDDNGLVYLWSKIVNKFVAKVDGKGLSTNDYTTAEKTKVSGIEAGANNYSLPTASESTKGGVKVGNGLTIDAGGVLSSTYGGTADNVAWTGVTGTPTTLSGYGITDAKINSGTITLGGNTITPVTDVSGKVDKISGKGLSTNDYTAAEKTKLSGIATGADVSPITSIKVNGTAQTITSKAVNITVPTAVSSLTNDSGYLTQHQDISGKADVSTTLAGYGITDAYTKSQVDAKITSTYKAKGTIAFASLPALTAANEGFVYNVSNDFVTTASFVEGAGNSYPAGTNVVVVNVGSNTYKYDVMAGFIDLSGYVLSSNITSIANGEIDTIVAS